MNGNNTYPSKDPILLLRQEMILRKFSPKTIKSYLYYISNLLKDKDKSPKNINTDDIRDYLEKMANNKAAASTMNTAYSAFKFYFEKILHRKFFINIPRAKKAKKLPVVLTKNEVSLILSNITNVKHKLSLALMYSSGLRISELINIKIGDIDLENKLLTIRGAKGQKDRVTIMSDKVMSVLEKYTKNKNGDNILFESNRGGKLSERSIQKVFKESLIKADIQKNATCHSLRHSFATHLLENGTDIRYIQELLGHARLETTQIYTKVANTKLKEIINPLD